MPTHEERLTVVEKDIAVMKRDIIYKLDETNSSVSMITGIVGRQGQDIKFLINQTKAIDVHLDGLDLRFDSIDSRFETLENRLTSLEKAVNNRFEALDMKFDQVLQLLSTLAPKPE